MTNNPFISDWIYKNIDANRSHHAKHILHETNKTRDLKLNLYQIATVQSLTLMMQDDYYNRASMFLTDNPGQIGSHIYKYLNAVLNNPAQQQMIYGSMLANRTISLNTILPRINDMDPKSPLVGTLCTQLNRNNLTFTQEATNSLVIKLVPDARYSLHYESNPISEFEYMLSKYHIATIYPTTQYSRTTIGRKPQHVSVEPNMDMRTILQAIDPKLLMTMPLYEQFGWLTSNAAELDKLNITKELDNNHGILTFNDVGGHMGPNKDHIYGHDIRINDTSAVYAPSDPKFRASRYMLWQDLTSYNKGDIAMNELRKQYNWLMNHNINLQNSLDKQTPDTGYQL